MAKQTTQEETRQQNVAEALSKAEQFFERYKSVIYYCFAGLLLIAAIILCVNRFYLSPKKAEAANQMYHAEQWFIQENYELALNGDDNYPGFEEIIASYGSKAGEAVYFYAGVCALRQNNPEQAIEWLKKYDGKDAILASKALSCEGDAYVALEDYNAALACFEKAAETADSAISAEYLVKAGEVAEELGETEKALAFYKKVKDQYPQAPQAMDIDKYISRLEK